LYSAIEHEITLRPGSNIRASESRLRSKFTPEALVGNVLVLVIADAVESTAETFLRQTWQTSFRFTTDFTRDST